MICSVSGILVDDSRVAEEYRLDFTNKKNSSLLLQQYDHLSFEVRKDVLRSPSKNDSDIRRPVTSIDHFTSTSHFCVHLFNS